MLKNRLQVIARHSTNFRLTCRLQDPQTFSLLTTASCRSQKFHPAPEGSGPFRFPDLLVQPFAMLQYLTLCLGRLLRLFRSRRSLLLENLSLRQQLVAPKRRRPGPRLSSFDQLFWMVARRFWAGWKQSLIIATPETVVRWHRAGFRLYWRFTSRVRKRVGRRQISKEVRDLIFRRAARTRPGEPLVYTASF
jgi:hypothetical protein